jgi:arylamine N-acetyltransferase
LTAACGRISPRSWPYIAHQYAIPFENLDVLLRRPVVLDLEANYSKIVVQRRTAQTHLSLRGRVLEVIHSTGVDKRSLNSADELVAALRESFDLDTPAAAALWPSICARHEALFAGTSGQGT